MRYLWTFSYIYNGIEIQVIQTNFYVFELFIKVPRGSQSNFSSTISIFKDFKSVRFSYKF